MKEVTQNLYRCHFFEFLQFSETRFYWAVFGKPDRVSSFIQKTFWMKLHISLRSTIAKQNLIHEGDAASCLYDDDDGLLQCSCACVSIQKSTLNSD